MKLLFFSILIIPYLGMAQTTGIHFESALSWQQIQAKAKAENKFIFMDCYATWCGPCKYMSQDIFTLNEVGDFFNAHFINVKVQMDETKADSAEVRSWYPDARSLVKKYEITAYPTYLFFAPDGYAVHRTVGATKEAKEFIVRAEEALNPDSQYYSFIDHYQEHKEDSLFLRRALTLALKSQDMSHASAIGNDYIDCLRNPFSKDNLQLIASATLSSTDKGFRLFLDSMSRVDSLLGKNVAEAKVKNVVFQEDLRPLLVVNAPAADWKKIAKDWKEKYPHVADRFIAESKVIYYQFKRQWPEYETAILFYMDKYGDQLGDFQHNEEAWNVFLYSENKKVLSEAAKWSKSSIDHAVIVNNKPESNYTNYLDTYANLLYKAGDKSSAITWEKKALEVAQEIKRDDKIKLYRETISKMEMGEKTWN